MEKPQAPVTVAVIQMTMTWDVEKNIARAEALAREAAGRGASIALLPELFATPYFCKDEDPRLFALAREAEGHPLLSRFSRLAAELSVVLPISFFEKAGNAHFNTVAVLDADGKNLGYYRKSHIPDGPGYEEKFYFSPGDTGFRVFPTRYGAVGVGICWDQWFPEAARAMTLMGADLLLYPTAIGSEPDAPALDSRAHWRRVMQGHAGANMAPVAAANRVGREEGKTCALTFYGTSFITDATGTVLADLDDHSEGIAKATLDFSAIRAARAAWGLFRDRRPDLYRSLLTLDGRNEGGA